MRRAKGEKSRRAEKKRYIAVFFLITGGLFGFGCQPNAAILESAKNSAAARANGQAEPAMRSFDRDLETMRTANFDFIYVMRRKDGAPLDADDKRYVKTNSPVETNRFILSDEEKAVIAGSKYKFAPENLKALQERLSVEDFSKPESAAAPTNAAENSNR